MVVFNSTNILIRKFQDQLRDGYQRTFGSMEADYADIICWAGAMALEIIASSDALYHNIEHTIHVSLVGMEILRGKHIKEGGVSPESWLHFMISLFCHDIGYVKGVCKDDQQVHNLYSTGVDGEMVELEVGSTDAALTPYHVDRGKLFIDERFGGHSIISTVAIKKNIELTRFPVPDSEDHKDTKHYPGLVRAADLIGQLSDPRYLQKITALYYEFKETGTADILGYKSPGDLRESYHKFFWNIAYPFIKDALQYLRLTQDGKQIISGLFANVFSVEHSSNKANILNELVEKAER
mmetsp:Transcript_11502/g.43162  ORF Transcript_11502/g.43162 Transcript_11502/m.43162 type:complete len:295 (-) Transcript_11502:1378-2262(-)|eukprot:CAMPEP_0117440662 /NCGR_PEP_ID=MMETSP0759-20121206/3214_1 /TAXON_ID=63605 /ORGANISM="Percolomonas cosmopolitus, Strain WS" /LENGTH=294 /DNA_ID=CAMNT_0005232451 /DNA_START=213 /DNA_END=1097 /DNA_ORIENTATION=-